MNNQIEKQINNLCAKIKSHYPNLYQETGGKYIRKTLRTMLENNYDATAGQAAYAGGAGSGTYRKNSYKQ